MKSVIIIGIALLLSINAPLLAQAPFQITRESRIGVVDGETALTEPGIVAATPTGFLLVSQPQEQLVRVFGPDGRPSSVIGRRGSGPGEFRHISNVGIRGDTVWIADNRLRKMSYFSRTGDLLRELSWPVAERAPHNPVGQHFAAVEFSRNGAMALDPNKPWPVQRFDVNGRVIDTMAVVHAYTDHMVIAGKRVVSPLADGALSDFSSTGHRFVVVDRRVPERSPTGQFVITWIDPSGDTIQRAAFTYTAKELPDEMISVLMARMSRNALPPDASSEVRQALRAIKYLPPISDVVTGDTDDAVWLSRERLGQRTVRWYRFTPAEGATGYIELPAAHRIVAARADLVWVVEKDELDVPYVARYKIRNLR